MKKLLFSVCAALSATALTAGEIKYEAVSFSTTGADKYADGSDVLDGEVYALVWTADGVFEGLNADGTTIDANDKLVVALALNQGEDVVINIDAANPMLASGQFGAYLVDTRTFGEDGVAKAAGLKNGKLKRVNATQKLGSQVSVSTSGAAETLATAAEKKAVASALPADIPQPKITDMELTPDNVILTVEGTAECANYAIQGGDTPTVNGATGTPKTGNGTIKLVYPKKAGGNFFKVIRK